MEKKRYTVIKNKIINTLILKNIYKIYILKSLKFNRNIEKKKRLLFLLPNLRKKNSISTYKSVCMFSGYKRSIINQFNSSRFILNKLSKLGLIQNYKP